MMANAVAKTGSRAWRSNNPLIRSTQSAARTRFNRWHTEMNVLRLRKCKGRNMRTTFDKLFYRGCNSKCPVCGNMYRYSGNMVMHFRMAHPTAVVRADVFMRDVQINPEFAVGSFVHPYETRPVASATVATDSQQQANKCAKCVLCYSGVEPTAYRCIVCPVKCDLHTHNPGNATGRSAI